MIKKLRILFITLMLACITAGVCLFAACDGDGGDKKDPPDVGPQTVAVESVTLNKTTLTLEEGEEETLTATVSPDNATNKTVSWTSSAEAVATVSGGKVTAVSEGTAVITAAAGGKSATCTVTVNRDNGGAPVVAVTGVTLNKTNLTLEVDGEETLIAEVRPENATDKTVVWTSSLEAVATVDKDGRVTAVAAGTAVITASAGGKSASCKVVVNARFIFAESISLNKTELTLEIGSEETLNVIFNPENATDKTVKWKAVKSNIATVDGSGKVTAVAEGTTAVIADAGNLRATCLVTVIPVAVKAESVTLNKTALTLDIGDEEALTATVLPADTTDKTVTWSSSAPDIATVDANGKVTAVAAGSAVITAKTANNKLATCAVTVNPPPVEVESVTLNKTTLTLVEGEDETLTATVLPADAADKTLTWISSAPSIATVDANGKVTAVAAGSATITAKTSNNITATCTVTVNEPTVDVDAVNLNKTELTLEIGSEEALTASVAPDNATDKTLTWTSSAPSIATVDANGKVTAIAVGSATVTVKSANNKTAACAVTVTEVRPKSLEFTKLEDANGNISYAVSGIGNITDSVIEIPAEHEGKPVTKIGANAFQYCSNLTSVTMPESVTIIDSRAFYECDGLLSINLHEGIKKIGNEAFHGCGNLTSVTIPASLETLGYNVFRNCVGLTSVNIREGITYIPSGAFQYCGYLKSVTIPDSVESIGNRAFDSCSKLENVTIPDAVTSLGISVFYLCQSLSSITFGSGLSVSDQLNFYKCSVNEIHFTGNIAEWCSLTWLPELDRSSSFKLYIGGVEVTGDIIIPEGVTCIGEQAFRNCTGITSVSLPDSLTEIGKEAFRYCQGLTKITIPDGVESIGNYAFMYSKVNSVIVGSGVTEIGTGAFDSEAYVHRIYYKGTEEEFGNISGSSYIDSKFKKYFYSESEPALNQAGTAYDGNYWHFDADEVTPVIWVKEN